MNHSLEQKLLAVLTKHPEIIVWGPVQHSQGYYVPYYFDFRGAAAIPAVRDVMVYALVAKVRRYRVQVIAGAETAGMAWGALVADRLKLPFVYVRKERKKFLNKRTVEGIFKDGSTAVLIDDTILFGTTKQQMIAQAERDGLHITHVLLTYASWGSAQRRATLERWFARHQVRLDACLTRQSLTDAFAVRGVVTPELQQLSHLYMDNPYGWRKTKRAKQLLRFLIQQRRRYGKL